MLIIVDTIVVTGNINDNTCTNNHSVDNNINRNTCINICINTCHKDANRIWVTILICNKHAELVISNENMFWVNVVTYQPTAQRQVHVVIFKRKNSTRLIP